MKLYFLLFSALLYQLSQAQTSTMNKGFIIFTLGTDTTHVGFYQLEKNEFQFHVLAMPNVSVTSMTGTLFDNGELKEATGSSYKPGPNSEEKRLTDYSLWVDADSTYIKQVRSGKESMYKFPGRAMIANALGTTFLYFLPLLIKYAPEQVGETIESYHFVLGQKRRFTIKRIANDVLEMGSGIMGYFKINLHHGGKVKFIDGIGSSWNVKGEIFDELNIDAYIHRFALKEQGSTPKPLNTKDSVFITINAVDIKIDYSRPSKRGRNIFGEVVPWNRIWRTGANEPTRLTINKTIYFEGKELPTGLYSVFTLPSKKGWTLIINSKNDMWGTDYDPAFDVLRIPMKTKKLEQPVETMTIDIIPKNKGGIISISWDKLKVYTKFKT